MTSVKALYADIENIELMKEHLAIRQQQYVEITQKTYDKEKERQDISLRLSSLKDSLEKLGYQKDPALVRQIAELEEQHKQANKEAEHLLRMQLEYNEEIGLQQKAISDQHLLNSITLKQVHKHQENISDAEREIDRIQSLIQDQTPLIRALSKAELPLNGLLKQKEDILADIASGTGSEKELNTLNEHIGQVLDNIDQVKQTSDRAKAAQIGLERKLDKAKQVLVELTHKNPNVLECALFSLAEKEGQVYFKLAEQLQNSFNQLMGFHALIKHHTPKRNGICLTDQALKLPGFNLDSAEQYMGKTDLCLFDWEKTFFYGNGELEAMNVELQKLRDAGVTII